jgi:hypothetical protein
MDKEYEAFFEKAKNLHLNEMEDQKCTNCLFQGIKENPVRAGADVCPNEGMTTDEISFFHKAQTTQLNAAEVSRAQKTVLAFVSSHPVDMVKAVAKREKAQNGFFTMIFSFRYHPALAAILLLVLGTGSVSYAAEFSVPGDMLYPVKIHVNESVQAHLAFSSEAQAEVNAKQASKRIREAKQLALAGRLTPDIRTKLTKEFEAHVEVSEQNIQKIAIQNKKHAEEVHAKTKADVQEQIAAIAALTQTENADIHANLDLLLKTVAHTDDAAIAANKEESSQIAMEITSQPFVQEKAAVPPTVVEPSTSGDTSSIIMPMMQKIKTDTATKTDTTTTTDTSTATTKVKVNVHLQNNTMMLRTGATATGSSKASTGSSSISIKSKGNTPVKIDIKQNGKVDVHIDTSVLP